ncbi:MAG: hypothetical protein MI976_22945 [Pseudomonadales bacterium]|nr:hypothetical protein [Pseudomonadales bacterium]
MISNEQLQQHFVTAPMHYYFHRKLAPLDAKEIDIRIEELLKYLNMATFCNGDIPFNKEIDEVWHYWIMETLEYEALCAKLTGKGFFHHSSNDYAEYFNPGIKQQKPDFSRGLEILVAYVLNYGEFEAERVQYWPLAQRIMELRNWDIRQLNEWLVEILQNQAEIHQQKRY